MTINFDTDEMIDLILDQEGKDKVIERAVDIDDVIDYFGAEALLDAMKDDDVISYSQNQLDMIFEEDNE